MVQYCLLTGVAAAVSNSGVNKKSGLAQRSWLLFDHGAVGRAEIAPTSVEAPSLSLLVRAVGVLGGQLFIHIDAPAGRRVGPKIAVLESGAPFEYLRGNAADQAPLLDAEVVAGEIEMELSGVADWRNVAGAVPGGLHAERLCEQRDFARHADAADLRDMTADEIDQAAGNERLSTRAGC